MESNLEDTGHGILVRSWNRKVIRGLGESLGWEVVQSEARVEGLQSEVQILGIALESILSAAEGPSRSGGPDIAGRMEQAPR